MQNEVGGPYGLLPLPMPLDCPICNSPALDLPHTGDATGFHCPIHGKFKVADTIVFDGYTRQQWEVALKKDSYELNRGIGLLSGAGTLTGS